MTDPDDLVRAVEATLFAAEAPLSAAAISLHLGGAAVEGPLLPAPAAVNAGNAVCR